MGVALLSGAILLGARSARAQQAQQLVLAHQVVTAPWAAPSQLPGHRPIATDVPIWEPPPLLKTPPPPALTDAERAIVQGTKSDRLPEPTWLRYVVSNEWRHDILFPRIAGLGGVYIGVATDQNYTMAAAARPQLLVLMDYDLEVVRIHRIYQAFLAESPTAKEFRALFDTPNAGRARALLQQNSDAKEAAQLQRVYNTYRERLQIYLRHVANLRVGERHPTWLGDTTAYEYIRALALGGRFLPIQGDLNGAVTLKSIGDTARALKLPVRAVYTSNAEGFFKYTPAFRDNLKSLPHDDKSVMIRTYKHGMPSPLGDTWHYNVHQLDDFLARLELPGYPSISRVMADLGTPAGGKAIDRIGISYYDAMVPRH